MKKLLLLLVLITSIAQAQYSVKGTMLPPNNTDWVILYKVEGAKQKFVANTNTKIETLTIEGKEQQVGTFKFTLPADTKTGSYRLTYRQDGSGFLDFLFNKEHVEMSFHPDYPEQSVVFMESKENQIFNEFLQATQITQKTVDSLQVVYLRDASESVTKQFPKAVKKLQDVYTIYDDRSKGLLANHFIKALKRDVDPKPVASPQEYFSSIVDNYFNNIDFSSKELYNSSFLIDRVSDYIFYLNYSAEPELQQKLFKESIGNVMSKITDVKLKKETIEYLVSQFAKQQNGETVDVLFNDYYSKLPASFQDNAFKAKKLALVQAAIGRIAPDFSWKEEGKTKRLSTLKGGKNYLLVFWSTSCSHCVKEVPELYKFMQTQKDTEVVAYALEKEDFEWNEFTKQLYGWHHVIGLNPKDKWDNKLVTETYQVHATPSYFVLDANKKIISKPYDLKEIKKVISAINAPKKDAKKATTPEKK
ncbi:MULTISPECIES: TlpA family protein disulfide reductase [Tenacibaculum]|uniref:TlpA family protein disulfide reductase n=1 Tax=Tenacibaculum TaxID=104267 RepID=UPI001F0A9195|nr:MULTISPECIES: TlpA disulfide reductase family protein [Tenacibaculum]MCH3881598.1 TlpA family protein disulfide reductase [Tenacibaculum aquimarinum]MDO6598814.1 TlpA disulfide reductase family protein [Tenacibaculum sp. 1_MG-2023]